MKNIKLLAHIVRTLESWIDDLPKLAQVIVAGMPFLAFLALIHTVKYFG